MKENSAEYSTHEYRPSASPGRGVTDPQHQPGPARSPAE